MYAIFVTMNVKPGCIEAFLEACVEEGKASVRDEPDCLRFEILRDKNNPDSVRFMEVFTDEKALETHWETPHFHKMWKTIEHMIEVDNDELEIFDAVEQVDMDFVYTSDPSLAS